MRIERWLGVLLAAALLVVTGGTARADYYTNSELRPQARCAGIPPGIGDPSDKGGFESLHCQRLFWDLPLTTALHTIAVGTAYEEDPIPRFPNGRTDRVPPMFIGTLNGTTTTEGFERESDCLTLTSDCKRLCTDPLDIPYWKELLNDDGSPQIGTDQFLRHGVDPITGAGTGEIQTGPLFQLECTRGSRSHYGPWQTGGTVDPEACKLSPGSDTNATAGACEGAVFDRIAATQPIRFENTDRLTDDVNNGRTTADKRLEWNMGTEFYNHFASHHGTCSQPSGPCADPNNPPTEADMNGSPGSKCEQYEKASSPGSSCYAGDADPRGCNDEDKVAMGGFRNATQLPGRLSVPLPGGRGVVGTEDLVWGCNHHVVTQLPPGSYSMNRLANYRLQTHGIVNTASEPIWGVDPGKEFGGSVGEMIIQYFARPLDAEVKPVNVVFNALADAATTYYPPFTWNFHESEWFPPFDAEVGLTAIHSHHRMVKGFMNVIPVNPPRPNTTDPTCGGGTKADGTPADLYTDWFWEDAPVCEYWKQVDGPVPLRKGQSLRTSCYVNNGITPEAMKHGLVAGASVQMLKELGAPIPDYPALVPTSTWGDALVDSDVGREYLYGTHPPINYRVVYKCSEAVAQAPGATLLVGPEGIGYHVCPPNPAVDADGDYVDGGYVNELQCGPGGLCQPGSIVFACIGEDEMCIGVAMYWAMDRLGSAETNDAAMAKLQAGVDALTSGDTDTAMKNLSHVGTPGNAGVATDISGICTQCDEGPGL